MDNITTYKWSIFINSISIHIKNRYSWMDISNENNNDSSLYWDIVFDSIKSKRDITGYQDTFFINIMNDIQLIVLQNYTAEQLNMLHRKRPGNYKTVEANFIIW